jgi:hypothetical protein
MQIRDVMMDPLSTKEIGFLRSVIGDFWGKQGLLLSEGKFWTHSRKVLSELLRSAHRGKREKKKRKLKHTNEKTKERKKRSLEGGA